jgi:hypothetical protein
VVFLAPEIYVKEPLSSRKIIKLLEEHPHLKKIKLPKSLYLRTSPKYLQALSQLGVEVKPVTHRGRPKKYGEKQAHSVEKMIKQGKSPVEISKTLQLPVKDVYYLKKSRLKRGRKQKYGEETQRKVKELYSKGFSVRDISRKLNIPLRTVYSLLKR